MKYRSLIFDFDGTIADTLDEALSIYNQIAGEHNLRTIEQEEVHYLRHMKLSDFLDHLAVPKRLVPKLLYKGTRILKSRISRLPMIQGMGDVLPHLSKQSEHFKSSIYAQYIAIRLQTSLLLLANRYHDSFYCRVFFLNYLNFLVTFDTIIA